MADLPQFCIFGDSHYACLRQAEAEGLADLSGIELEYWGHVGSGFRFLEVRDGAVQPGDDKVARSFARFNAKRRLVLPAADFDGILVMGARVYVWRLFVAVLRALESGSFLSQGLMRQMLVDAGGWVPLPSRLSVCGWLGVDRASRSAPVTDRLLHRKSRLPCRSANPERPKPHPQSGVPALGVPRGGSHRGRA